MLTVLGRIFSAHFFIVDLLRNSHVAWYARIQQIRRECGNIRLCYIVYIRIKITFAIVEIVKCFLLIFNVM